MNVDIAAFLKSVGLRPVGPCWDGTKLIDHGYPHLKLESLSPFDQKYLGNHHGGNLACPAPPLKPNAIILLEAGVNSNLELVACRGAHTISSIQLVPTGNTPTPTATAAAVLADTKSSTVVDAKTPAVELTLVKYHHKPDEASAKTVTTTDLMTVRTMFVPYLDMLTRLQITSPIACRLIFS